MTQKPFSKSLYDNSIQADGDFAFSAESGTVWMYDTASYNSGQVVPDQVSHASDATSLVYNAVGAAGISNDYAKGDYQHPLQVSSVLPQPDTVAGETWEQEQQVHQIYILVLVINTLINVDPSVANVHLVNATAAANGTSDYYCRSDHVHAQQLTQDGNITAIKFIETRGLPTEILSANGDNKDINGVVDIATDQTITDIKTFNNIFQAVPTGFNYNKGIRIAKATNGPCQILSGVDPDQYNGEIEGQQTVGIMINQSPIAQQFAICQSYNFENFDRELHISADRNALKFNGNGFIDVGSDQTIIGKKTFATGFDSGNIQINPTATSCDDGLKISRSEEYTGGSSLIHYVNNPLGLTLTLGFNSGDTNRGLQISACGNTFSFNGQIIAGNGAPNGQVNHSQGNPNLWGISSTGTNCGFYSRGNTVFWRDNALQFDPYNQEQ
ncbi:MAG: hypothetical protein EZS28_000928 [Streblomastix strix]|uniref:Uncharacterized protein n=1 Tax=Streblomastix strix TaxID=222440 RepID=A0A5J4X8H7_9EUKA|nr:MAG: hypothetical protein EZS28_000928 [Streblomastix strix]